MSDEEKERLVETIQQLWECIGRGYNLNESKIHMRAFRNGKTTVRKVIVVGEDDND